jgi:hypothetical protein
MLPIRLCEIRRRKEVVGFTAGKAGEEEGSEEVDFTSWEIMKE